MDKPNQQQRHSKNTLEALADARIANLVANHWTPVRQGDIADLRRGNTYHLFELRSFATHMARDARGNVTNLLFEIWRRPLTAPVAASTWKVSPNSDGAHL
jgi:hypothetical protein